MTEKIDPHKTVFFRIGSEGMGVNEQKFKVISRSMCNAPLMGVHNAQAMSLCAPPENSGDRSIRHLPSVGGVEEAIARSAARVLESTQGQLIPGVMAEVQKIREELLAEHGALVEQVKQQQATIVHLQQQLLEVTQQLKEHRFQPPGNSE